MTREEKWKEIDDILAKAKSDLAETSDVLDEIEQDLNKIKKKESC